MALLTWFQTSGLQSCKRIHFCFEPLVCGNWVTAALGNWVHTAPTSTLGREATPGKSEEDLEGCSVILVSLEDGRRQRTSLGRRTTGQVWKKRSSLWSAGSCMLAQHFLNDATTAVIRAGKVGGGQVPQGLAGLLKMSREPFEG